MALFYTRARPIARGRRNIFADETEVTFTDDWLLKLLLAEKRISYSGGIYRYTQIAFAYHSCAIDGGELTYEQVESLYDTYTVPTQRGDIVSVGDIMTAFNHFALFDVMLENAKGPLAEDEIKGYHTILKRGTIDERRQWFTVGDYKTVPSVLGPGLAETSPPEKTPADMRRLLKRYAALSAPKLEDILDFHYRFEVIHPFQDCNGIIGRMLMYKECLNYGLIPVMPDCGQRELYLSGLADYRRNKRKLFEEFVRCQTLYGEVCEAYFEKRKNAQTELVFSEFM